MEQRTNGWLCPNSVGEGGKDRPCGTLNPFDRTVCGRCGYDTADRWLCPNSVGEGGEDRPCGTLNPFYRTVCGWCGYDTADNVENSGDNGEKTKASKK